MRKTIVTIIVLGLIVLGYVAWPFYDLFRFINAADRGDVAEVERSVDFPAVRQSLAQQIVIAYFQRTGARINPLLQGMATSAAASVADPIVAKLMTPEALIDFLRNGWPTATFPDGPPGIVGISPSSFGTVWETFVHTDYGFGRFDVVVPVTAPAERQFNLRFRLSQWRWQLKAIGLPETVQNQFADELIKSTKASAAPP
jgi:Protein of unknown function (DUF2939)